MYKNVEHTAIAAKDTAGLSAWYCKTLGFKVAYDNKKSPPTMFVKLGDSLIELIPASDKTPVARESADPGLSHFAIAVDDFDAALADLKKKGVAISGIREASGGVKVGFFPDPEGNLLQIIYRPNPL